MIKGNKKNYVLANQVHVDSLLSNISVKYKPEGFIGMEMCPQVVVKKTSDLFRVYDRNFKIPETKRANKGEAREHNFEVSTASYNLVRHSLKSFVSDTDADNYDLADLRAETVEELTEKIMLRHELDVATLFTKTAWSLTVSLAAGLTFADNTTTSNPIPIFQTGASVVIANSGMKPNFGMLPRAGLVACVNHGSILDRLKYTSAEVDAVKLAALFDLPKGLLVPAIAYDNTNTVTASIVSIWSAENAWLGYKPDAPGPLKASSLYTFKKAMPLVKRWRVEERESECIEVNMEYEARVVASLSGYLIANVT